MLSRSLGAEFAAPCYTVNAVHPSGIYKSMRSNIMDRDMKPGASRHTAPPAGLARL